MAPAGDIWLYIIKQWSLPIISPPCSQMPSYGFSPSFNSAASSSDSITSYSTYIHGNGPSELPNYEEALHQPRYLDDEYTHLCTPGSLPSSRVTTALSGQHNSLSRTLSNSTPTSFSSTSSSESGSSSSITTSASTPTLTNPSPPLSLIFDRNSVISATLHARTGPRYRITTNKTVTRTDLYELSQGPSTGSSDAPPVASQSKTLVASVKRRELLPNVVVFKHREGKTMRLGRWLKREKGGHLGRASSAELSTPDGRYTWIANDTHRLALYSHQIGGDPNAPPCTYPIDTLTQRPIAYCKTLNDPPTLALVLRDSECSEATQIEIIMSFLVMENKLRQKEKFEEGRRSSMMHTLGAHIRMGSVG